MAASSSDQPQSVRVDAELPGAPKTLAEDMGIEPPRKLTFETCYKAVESLHFVDCESVKFVPFGFEQTADFLDMPLSQETPTGPVTHAFIIETDVDQALDLDVATITDF